MLNYWDINLIKLKKGIESGWGELNKEKRSGAPLQGLMEMGARKIAVVGLPPIGCVPAVISLNSDNALTHRGCIQRLSSVARDYNRLLQLELSALQRRSPGATLVYVDIYNPIDRMVNNPQKYGTSFFFFLLFFPNK